MGIDLPGVGPSSQLTPRVSVLQRRDEDAVFAGAVDVEVGLLADDGRLVHDGVGRVRETSPSGALTQPTKTMFQTALLQPDHLLLRDSHCCCEAGTTLPSTTESARKPPLAQPAFHFASKSNRCSSPLTCSRRSGAAWETAIRVMPLVARRA